MLLIEKSFDHLNFKAFFLRDLIESLFDLQKKQKGLQ